MTLNIPYEIMLKKPLVIGNNFYDALCQQSFNLNAFEHGNYHIR
jgi:hypothetical protein